MINCGVDLVSVSHMERCLKNPRFQTRVFSAEEQEMLKDLSDIRRAESAAANFAAKEAFAKALGTGVRGFSLSEISVLRRPNGAPYLLCSGKAKQLLEQRRCTASVTLSHDGGMACAVVLLQKKEASSLPALAPERIQRLQKRFGPSFSGGTPITPELVRSLFPHRAPDSHKGSYGKLTILAGCKNYRGAAALCTHAALRSGAGVITLASVEPVIQAVAAKLYEPVYHPLAMDDNGTISALALPELSELAQTSSAFLLGCGLGISESTQTLTEQLVQTISCPLILDADGINCAARRIDILRTAKGSLILTPHLGEMSRLCGKPISEIKADPISTAKEFAAEYRAVVVLKDAVTVIALPDGRVYLNTTGNAGMARGGSGDVLAGMIAAFAAQGLEPGAAAVCGVYLHGAAGDLTAAESSMLGMLPSDMIASLPKLYHFAEEDPGNA